MDFLKDFLLGEDILTKWGKMFLQIVLFLACICYFMDVPNIHQVENSLSVIDRSFGLVFLYFFPFWVVICCYLVISDN